MYKREDKLRKQRIGFVGATHLGVNSAVAAAERGFLVTNFDTDEEVIAGLAKGEAPVTEPKLQELLVKNQAHMTFTTNIQDLAECGIVYISKDVPTDDAGRSALSGIEELIEQVARVLAGSSLLVILCQVPPGFTRLIDYPKDQLYYQVETLIFGRAIERAMYPERFIIGCADASATLAEEFRLFLEAFDCPILPMRYESAELAKISINCFLVASVSTANTLAELCEEIGADWSEIKPALKLDRRIGQYAYLNPGLGIAGGNLERDLATVIRLAKACGTDASVVEAWVHNSRHCRDWAFRVLHKTCLEHNPSPRIGVLGLAYKQDTHSTKNSPSLALLEKLSAYDVRVYDPVVDSGVVPYASGKANAFDVARGSDAVLIMTPWSEFGDIDPASLVEVMSGRVVIDPYGVLDADAVEAAGMEYHTLGLGTRKV